MIGESVSGNTVPTAFTMFGRGREPIDLLDKYVEANMLPFHLQSHHPVFRMTRLLIVLLLLLVGMGNLPLLAQHKDEKAHSGMSVPGATGRLRSLYFSRDYEGGYIEGKELISEYPDSTDLRAWFVLNAAANGFVKEAKLESQKMVDAKEDDPWSLFALAGALSHDWLSRFEALKASEKAFSKMLGHEDFLWLRTEVLMNSGSPSDAMKFIKKNQPKLKNSVELKIDWAWLLFMDAGLKNDKANLIEALELLREIRMDNPFNVNAYFWEASGQWHAQHYTNNYIAPYELMKRAIELAPNSTSVHKQFWQMINARRDISDEQKRAEVEKDMSRFLERRGSFPGALLEISRQYGELRFNERQNELESKILQQWPHSLEAEEVIYNRINRSDGEFIDQKGARKTGALETEKLWGFIERPYHYNDEFFLNATRALFLAIKDDPATDPKELARIALKLANLPAIQVDSDLLSQVAISLARHKEYLQTAKAILQDAIEDESLWVSQMKSVDTEPIRYRGVLESFSSKLSDLYDGLGWIYFIEGRRERAEKKLLDAYSLSDNNLDNLYHLGELYKEQNRFDRAEEFYMKCLELDGRVEIEVIAGSAKERRNPCIDGVRNLYAKRFRGLHGFDDFWKRIRTKLHQQKADKVLATRIDPPVPVLPFSLKTLDGSTMDLASLKGGVAVINFWGLWCGGCVAELPNFQKLVDKYSKDPNVAFVTIDVGDEPEEVRKWINERHYTFTVLLDDKYVEAAEVHGFPTTWFLDTKGRKVFERVGGTLNLLEEFSLRIAALRQSAHN